MFAFPTELASLLLWPTPVNPTPPAACFNIEQGILLAVCSPTVKLQSYLCILQYTCCSSSSTHIASCYHISRPVVGEGAGNRPPVLAHFPSTRKCRCETIIDLTNPTLPTYEENPSRIPPPGQLYPWAKEQKTPFPLPFFPFAVFFFLLFLSLSLLCKSRHG
ncbi:hypothetical protein K504DRAFT_113368 [Pleomassaria siparia CBS 279.74]|uniref:Uncharacterized protein n=1 Tax=Pleomassaria siparia CBS 279.74 TaxID=1314801 RepID=A0A6G1JX62_9PLEO|nr:hypothetical protein K504DRAFT_113368 [Pleomassaria siparia CBS 279.74]